MSNLIIQGVNTFQENIPCLYNFASSAPGSTNTLSILQRFCEELSRKLNEDPPKESETSLYETSSKLFQRQLKDISDQIPGFTVVLDAVNQFTDDQGKRFDWLPSLSEETNVQYLISCTPDFHPGDLNS